jgi:hypothetical protein
MRARTRVQLNSLSIVLILLAALLFFIYLIYTIDLRERQLQMHRDTARFVLTLVDERVQSLKSAAEPADAVLEGPGGESAREKLYLGIAATVSDYFDLEGRVSLLLFHTETGEILYSSSGRERTLAEGLESAGVQQPEGELNLSDRFGYYVGYPDPPITLFVYTMSRELFMYRNQLLYITSALVALFAFFFFINLKRVVKRWDGFLSHMSASFSDVIQGKKKWPEGISEEYGEEFGDFPTWYNGMLERVASVFKQMEERLRSLFKQRDNLKKMIFFYKKYIPDDMLLRTNEKDVDDIVSRKQDVSCLDMELVSFLEPIDELYPQVITDELNELHVFLKEEVIKKGGVINYSRGYRINIVYGVPKVDDVSFNMACAGAQKILQWVEERNNSERNMSGIKWNVKFGLTYGTAITGIVGFDYMVIGDVIERGNAMLEFAKRFDVPLITDSLDMLKALGTYKYRKLDIVTEGKSSTRSIFEVFLKKNELIDQAIKLYNHALEMFYDEKYEVAVLEFKKVAATLDDDKPSRIFLSRCERAIKGKKGPSLSS